MECSVCEGQTPEVYLPVVGYEGVYAVSNYGNVKSLDRPVKRERLGKVYTIAQPGRVMTLGTNDDGYRTVELSLMGRRSFRLVHNLVIESHGGGPKPDGLWTRHLDGNPAHNHRPNLAYGTWSENMLDKVAHGTDHNAAKTHCPQGHDYTPENTVVWQGSRSCRACNRDACRRSRAKRAQPTY